MRKKVKVLQLGSPSGLYGAEYWILALIKHLNPCNIESWVGSIRDEPDSSVPVCLEAKRLGFKTVVVESYGKISFSSISKLRQSLLDNEIDIVHTHGYKTDLIGRLACYGTSCKILTTPHGWTNKPDLKLRLYELIDRSVFPLFDAVVPLSEGLFAPLAKIPWLKSKLYLINNAVDLSEIDEAPSLSQELKEIKENGSIVVGYIGRLTSGKGLDQLLNAVSMLPNSIKENVVVVLIGEGEQKAELESLVDRLHISSRVRFLGFRADRLSLLKGFDIFVLPSRSEGIPRCLMEAMGAEVPIIASDIPGCRSLVKDGKTGLLFELENCLDLADKIEQVIRDPSLKNNLKREAKKFILDNHSASRMAQEYEELFFKMVSKK